MKTSRKANFVHVDRLTIFIVLLCLASGLCFAAIIAILQPLDSLSGLLLSLVLASVWIIILGISIQQYRNNLNIVSANTPSFLAGLEYLINVLPYRAVLLDRNGNYLKIIKSFPASSTDIDLPVDVQGKSLHDVLSQEVADYVLHLLKQCIAENATQVVEYSYPVKGKLYYLEGHVIPITDRQSQETTVLWIARDITERRQREQALINDEQRIRSIASALPDRTVILTADGSYYDVLKINYETAPIGLSHPPRGKQLHEVFDKQFADFCLAKVQETIEKDALQLFEYPYEENAVTYRLEGRTIPYDDIVSGEKRVIWISRDITERKKQEQALLDSQKLLRTIIGVFPDRTLILNRDGQYQEILKAQRDAPNTTARIHPVKAGDYIQDNFPKDFADFCLQMIHKTIASGEIQVFEYDSPIRDDEYKFEGRTIPFKDPISGEDRVLWVSRDISLSKEAEQQRLALIVEKEKLEFFRDFVNNMTHDLKTPLSVIETSLYLMQRLQDSEKQQKQLNIARDRVRILTQMIDDMLAAARLDNIPQFDLHTIELSDFLNNILDDIRPKAEHKEQILNFNDADRPIIVEANDSELRRAITNLIDNAIKYTPEKGQIEISVYMDNSDVVIKIQDSGIGISPSSLPHIFERFYRSENGRFAAHGTGLGLTITQHIIQLHGGNIDVESEVGQGSTFFVRLPVYQSAYAD